MFNKSGFTLLELLSALIIIGILMAIGARYLRPPSPAAERKKFILQLNSLMKFVWQNAVVTGKVHKVDFDFQKRVIQTFVEQKGEKDKPIARTYLKTSLDIPAQLEIKNFFIEGYDMMKKFTLGKTTGAFFYVMPEGLSQAVIINMLDTKDEILRGRSRQVSLVLNPFSAQFKIYDEFRKP